MVSESTGALCFGLVIGWVTYRTLRRTSVSGLSDIATVIGAVGGGAITGLFSKESGAFGSYSVGLAIGFFVYLITALMLAGKSGRTKTYEWLGEMPGQQGNANRPGSALEQVAGGGASRK